MSGWHEQKSWDQNKKKRKLFKYMKFVLGAVGGQRGRNHLLIVPCILEVLLIYSSHIHMHSFTTENYLACREPHFNVHAL